MLSNKNINHPYKIYGFFNSNQNRFYPLYVVDAIQLNIWLLLDWIIACQISSNINIQINSNKHKNIETIFLLIIKKVINVYNKSFSQKSINNIKRYFESSHILNYLVSLLSENNHLYQFDLIASFLSEDISCLSYPEFVYSLDSILLYPSSIDNKINIVSIMNKLNKSFESNRGLIDRVLDPNPCMSSKITYGEKYPYQVSNIISIEHINNKAYCELIKFIKRSSSIDSLWFHNEREKFITKNVTLSLRMINRNSDLSEIVCYLHNRLLLIINELHIIERITDIVKVDDFTLWFITEKHTYHIDLMIIPLTTHLLL